MGVEDTRKYVGSQDRSDMQGGGTPPGSVDHNGSIKREASSGSSGPACAVPAILFGSGVAAMLIGVKYGVGS